jgi:hypothetical protein
MLQERRAATSTDAAAGNPAEAIVALAKDYQPQGLAMVAISSNYIGTHPQDGPEKMAEDAKRYGGLPPATSCPILEPFAWLALMLRFVLCRAHACCGRTCHAHARRGRS